MVVVASFASSRSRSASESEITTRFSELSVPNPVLSRRSPPHDDALDPALRASVRLDPPACWRLYSGTRSGCTSPWRRAARLRAAARWCGQLHSFAFGRVDGRLLWRHEGAGGWRRQHDVTPLPCSIVPRSGAWASGADLLAAPQRPVDAVAGDEVNMRPRFDDRAAVEHEDLVGVLDRRKAMRDHD